MQAPKSGGDYEKHPIGWTTVVCTRVIDLGTHFNPNKNKHERKLMIGFESSKLMQDGEFKGEPLLLHSSFNFSMYQNSHLCKFVENWRSKRFSNQAEADVFDFKSLIGKTAFVNVVHSDDGKYVNIQTIGPVPEGIKAPEVKGKTILIDQDNFDKNEAEKLSEKLKERVLSAIERTEAVGKPEEVLNQTQTKTSTYDERNPPPFDDGIPFS